VTVKGALQVLACCTESDLFILLYNGYGGKSDGSGKLEATFVSPKRELNDK
jgi:hypothetical protein